MRVAIKGDDVCSRCFYSQAIYEERVCTFGVVARPQEHMRNPNSPCGPEASLFKPRTEEEK